MGTTRAQREREPELIQDVISRVMARYGIPTIETPAPEPEQTTLTFRVPIVTTATDAEGGE